MAGKHGGKRPNTPPPPDKTGQRWPSTLAKEAARELFRARLTERMGDVADALVANATGIKHLVARDKDGKFGIIGPDKLAGVYAAGGTVEVWEKDPSVEAAKELLNRALDQSPKPAETLIVKDGDFGVLDRAKERARGKKP